MSAIITNYELTLKDGADPSTSTAAANLNAQVWPEASTCAAPGVYMD